MKVEIPKEIKLAIKSLHSNNDITYNIVEFLIMRGKATLSDFEEELDYESSNIEKALNNLETGGIILRKNALVEDGKGEECVYHISPFGEKIIKSLHDAYYR